MHRWSSTALSVPPSDYLINVGRATRILRQELPHFFLNGLSRTDIYSSSIIFKDPFHRRIQIHGKKQYLMYAQGLRVSSQLYFSNISFSILGVHSLKSCDLGLDDPAKDCLQIRWEFEGLSRFGQKESLYEGVFVYIFDHSGRVGEHLLERIHPVPPSLAPCRWFSTRLAAS